MFNTNHTIFTHSFDTVRGRLYGEVLKNREKRKIPLCVTRSGTDHSWLWAFSRDKDSRRESNDTYLYVPSGLLLGKMVSFLWDAWECPSGQNDSGPLEDTVWPKITS